MRAGRLACGQVGAVGGQMGCAGWVKITENLRAEGFAAHQIAQQVLLGQLLRLRRGAYLAPGEATDPIARHLHLIAATLPLLAPGSVLSHLSAGLLHDLPIPTDDLSRVTVLRDGSTGGGRRTPYLHLRRDSLRDGDLEELNQFTVTTLSRTTCDLVRTTSYERAVMIADRAMALGLPREELRAALAHRPGRPGNNQLRSVAAFASPLAESPGESFSRVRMAQNGIPQPLLQYEVYDGELLVGRTDFAWPELGILGEFDGKIKYGDLLRPGETPQQALFREKRREDALRQLGWQMARWCWDDLVHPERFVRTWNQVRGIRSPPRAH